MILTEAFRMAARSLWQHKARSLLTILGVVIGIGAVLAVVTIGASFEETIVSQFDAVDDRAIFVQGHDGSPLQGPPDAGQFGLIFTDVDRQALQALPGVETVLAEGQVPVAGLSYNGTETPFKELIAVDTHAQVLGPGRYASGGVFTEGQEEVVLGATVAERLANGTFQAVQRIGIRMLDGSLRMVDVAGVLHEQDGFFAEANGMVYAPLDPFYPTAAKSPTTGQEVPVFTGLTVIVGDPRDVRTVRDRVEQHMLEASDASRLLVGTTEILVMTPGDITEGISDAFETVTAFIGTIGAISLLVGAIGIANIMLVAVAERTREIGVMKAIGALDSHVLSMFLIEAALVGAIGSLFGLALGLGAGYLMVRNIFDQAVTWPLGWIVASVVIGVLVGLLAGFLPARRATKVDPVVALARE